MVGFVIVLVYVFFLISLRIHQLHTDSVCANFDSQGDKYYININLFSY